MKILFEEVPREISATQTGTMGSKATQSHIYMDIAELTLDRTRQT